MSAIIGLSGFAQSGKDTVGKILVEKHGFQSFAFAGYLREVCCAFDPIVDLKPPTGVCRCECHHNDSIKHFAPCCYPTEQKILRFSEALDTFGYEVSKSLFPEFRRTLQYMGTEVVRNKIQNSFWVDHVFEAIEESECELAVVTDARFENEVAAVEEWGGYTVWVARPGVGPVNGHISDNGLGDWVFDATLDNSGTLEDLEAAVESMLQAVL